MRKYVLIGCLTISLMAAGQSSPSMLLSGKLPVTATGYVYLSYPDSSSGWRSDSCLPDKGHFVFRLPISSPVLARLSHNQAEEQLFIEPGEIHLWADDKLSNMQVTGSESHKTFELLNRPLKKLRNRWAETMDSLVATGRRNNIRFQEMKDWVMKPYYEEMNEIYLDFFRDHPNSIVTAQALLVSEMQLPVDTVKFVYDRLPAAVKESQYGRRLSQLIANRSRGAVNTRAPDFSRNDVNGKPLSLLEYRGRYVLIDFWASWCLPCRKNNPHLKELYARYRSKGLEIIGIAADDATPDAWHKAIAEDAVPWRHILQGNKPGTDIGALYNVRTLPTKLLIDKDGMIIGRFGSESEALDMLLEQAFAEQINPDNGTN